MDNNTRGTFANRANASTISTSAPSLRSAILWQAALLLLVLASPVALLKEWPWELARRELIMFAALLAAFVAAAGLNLFARSREITWRVMAALAAGTIFSAVLLGLLMLRDPSSRTLAIAIFVITVLLLPLPSLHPRFRWPSIGILVVAFLAITTVAATDLSATHNATERSRLELSVGSNLYNLKLTSYVGYVRRPAVRGGGFTEFGDHVLLASGDGALYLLDSTAQSLTSTPLSIRVPLNGEEFAAAVGGKYEEPKFSSQYGMGAPPAVQTWRFRTADVAAQRLGDHMRLFASHHYWNDADKCFVLRVSAIEVSPEGVAVNGPAGQWRTLFDTKPCLPITGKDAKRGKNPFQGEEIGGRMLVLDDHTLLLTVGDMSFSGVEAWQIFSQDPQASYGKTITIRTDTGESSVYTLGHRNPQGLFKDSQGDLWLTEHGPKGGDELNLLKAGVNYGWPQVTYGTDYLTFAWPLNPQQGRHDGYEEPVYAWVPSIGISQMIELQHDLFPGWRNDFLVGALSTRALYRLRTKNHRVIFAEPIPIQQRVRDLFELPDGRVLVWTDAATLMDIRPTEEMSGSLLFGSMCQSCHWIHDGLSHRAGPDLFGILDKDVASSPNFEYSRALKSFGGQWTRERLDQFLSDPQATAPGTQMNFEGIADAQQRALVIEHLRTNLGQ
ncbi:MAG: PQQ-dependent sugar dehydrogenase [Povalibacter sp.]